MHTCRFCGDYKDSRSMVKYATRHWAHFGCWLKTKGLELGVKPSFDAVVDLLGSSFHDWQLKQFPVFQLSDWMEQAGIKGPFGRPVDNACAAIKSAIVKNVEVSR